MREKDVHDGTKKKSKKRKNKESITSNEEVGNVQVGGRDSKKLKTELLYNANASEAVGEPKSDSGVGQSPKKEKIIQDGSKIDGKGRENDNKRKKKKEKNKVRDEGGTSCVLEAPEEIYGESDDRLFSERQTRKKEKTCVEEIKIVDGQAMKDQDKNAVFESDGGVACGFEKEGEEQTGEDGQVKKNKKKRKKDKLQRKDADCNSEIDGAGVLEIQAGTEVIEKVEAVDDKEKKKKKKNKRKDDDDFGSSVINERNKSVGVDGNGEEKKIKKKKKKDDLGAGSVVKEIVYGETNKANEVAEPSDRSTSHKKMKKVTFSNQNEYFSVPNSSSKRKKKKLDDDGKGNKNQDDGLIRGKRFSKAEDELVEKAVLDYIEEHQLGENGLEMVLKCKSHPEVKDCWKEIGKALPHRPYMSVYYRAHILFERSESRKWTQEELDLVKVFYEKHGADWKTLADELGKHRFHVKDAWRRIRLPNRKKGDWSQDEYQTLFDLVNLDLSIKVFQEKKSKHGMLRDNISWEAISEKLATRSNAVCCQKWYYQLTSSLVAEGKWVDTDDYRLLMALTEHDAACEEDVDWDNLLEHRLGDVCRERWNQMVRHIGHHGVKPFVEQVEILSQRYCPDVLESREVYESKPAVD